MITNEQKQRYSAFWNHNLSGGCLLFATKAANWDDAEDVFGIAETPEWVQNRWLDIDARWKNEIYRMEHETFYADAFPTTFANFGPGSLAACIGGSFECARDTVWFDTDPIIKDFKNLPKIELDTNSEMWKLCEELTQTFCERSDGKYFTSMADVGGGLDIMASLRGTNELLYDLYDTPDEIKALIGRIREYWKAKFTHLYNISQKYQSGMTSWMPIWCEKRYYPLQADFAAMISPDMFEEFAMPDLKEQTEFLDHSVFHLDGPNMIPHLDHLLSLPRLDAIQWSAGAGNSDELDECYFEMYQKIQKAGKNVVIFCGADVERIEKLLKALNPNQLFISAGANDEYTVNAIVELARKIV